MRQEVVREDNCRTRLCALTASTLVVEALQRRRLGPTLPLVGAGWGSCSDARVLPQTWTPTPSPSPAGCGLARFRQT